MIKKNRTLVLSLCFVSTKNHKTTMRLLFFVIVVNLLMTSCNTNLDDVNGAKDYCECFDLAQKVKEKTDKLKTKEELLKLVPALEKDIKASNTCILKWQSDYMNNSKLTSKGFARELKKLSPAAYDDAMNAGVF